VPAPSSRPADAGAIVARAGGVPAIVAYEADGRRIVEWRFDPESGSLPLSAALPVLVARTLAWLDAQSANASAIEAGASLQWRLPGVRAPESVAVVSVDGRSENTSISQSSLRFDGTSAAGVYRVRLASGERTFVVNPAADRESDVSRPASAPASPAGAASGPAMPAETAAGVLIACALILLAVEWHYRSHRRWPLQGRG
jgi:hypothetical protein